MKAVDTVLTFGKYNGQTLGQIYNQDKDYLVWLACNSYQMHKKAQEVYEQKLKEEGENLKNFKAEINGTSTDYDLNVLIHFNIQGRLVVVGFRNHKDADRFIKLFKKDKVRVHIAYQYGLMFFDNYYEKNGYKNRWIRAEKRVLGNMEFGTWCFNFSPIKPMKKNAIIPIPSVLKK